MTMTTPKRSPAVKSAGGAPVTMPKKLDQLLGAMHQGVADLAVARETPPTVARERFANAGQVHRLMELVEARFGIHPTAQMERKLAMAFSSTTEESLKIWVDLMESLPAHDSGWYSVVETLTVHETYFCRDRSLLWMLAGDVLPLVLAQNKAAGNPSLRIWSAGCSTGEEAYNLAMLVLQTLAEMGEATIATNGEIRAAPRWRVEILGTDVSRQVVHIADNAVYADFAMGPFRDMPASRRVFFERIASDDIDNPLPGVSYYRVRAFAKRLVSFRHHNLMTDAPPREDFDIVLCRNVMIYFQNDTKRRIQDMFHRALVPGGVLLLGPTDVLLTPDRYERRFGDGGAWHIKNRSETEKAKEPQWKS